MATICIFCGGNCGRVCRGLGFKSSDGGGEQTRYSVKEGVPYPEVQANQSPSKRTYRKTGEEAPAGPRTGSRIGTAGVTPGPSGAKPKLGRPRIGEVRDKPWLTSDPPMSERTWYRRQEEKRAKEERK